MEDKCGVVGMVWGQFKHITIIVHLYLLLFHQLHLRSSGVRPQGALL